MDHLTTWDNANEKYYRHSESRSALEVWRKRQSTRKHYEHMFYDANGNPIFVLMLQDMDGNLLSEWAKIASPSPSTMTTRDSLVGPCHALKPYSKNVHRGFHSDGAQFNVSVTE